MFRRGRTTPPGEHRAVLLDEVLKILDPQPGEVAVDATVGWAGHAVEILRRLGPSGRLIGLDFDAEHLPKARERLQAVGHPFALHQGNFAGVAGVLAAEGIADVHLLVADLGMSSLQLDDAERGFSYMRDGVLDMRMDRSRGRTAAQLLASIASADLAQALHELGDEPEAERVAAAVVEARARQPILRTAELARVVVEATRVGPRPAKPHPRPERAHLDTLARVFQTLRILVNRELANLQQLVRVLPEILHPGGRAAIISFHSGEDRLVKTAFRDGLRAGCYERVSDDPVRPSWEERSANPRARSAKLRWAIRSARK